MFQEGAKGWRGCRPSGEENAIRQRRGSKPGPLKMNQVKRLLLPLHHDSFCINRFCLLISPIIEVKKNSNLEREIFEKKSQTFSVLSVSSSLIFFFKKKFAS